MQLEVSNLSFEYSNRKILEEISFCATDGDFIAVIGPNGVGKSTLFRCILGFLHLNSGIIKIDGIDISECSRTKIAKNIAYIPQTTQQVFDFSVLDLVLMGTNPKLRSFSNPKAVQIQECMDVMEDLGISHLSNRGCTEISGGEFQLVMIARALVQNAKILIFDEPTANLDYGNNYKVMNRIEELSHLGYIIIMSTHDPNQVFLYANRALVLSKGKLISDGKPDLVLTQELLSDLYQVYINRHKVDINGCEHYICLPSALRRV